MRLPTASLSALLLLVALAVPAGTAQACIRGPLPLTFIGQTARLDGDGKFLLKEYGRERPHDILQVIFYKSAVPRNIVEERRRNVLAYLRTISRQNVAVAYSEKPLPKLLADHFGYRATATVEVTKGCF